MYLHEVPRVAARAGTTFVTRFHPGVNHAHAPTGRWVDVQSDAASRCQGLRDRAFKDPRHAPAIAEALAVECACSKLSPRNVARVVRNTLMRLLPLAQLHLDHYIDGHGATFNENLEDVIRRDRKVRAKLASHVRANSKGHFKVNQSDFDVKDFQFAFGAIDRLDFEVNRAAGLVHVWFQDRYEWHPVGFGYNKFPDDSRRSTNCVHAAMVELKNSGARDYWMQGDALIPLSVVLAPAASPAPKVRNFESEYEHRVTLQPTRRPL
jgi:hypothetical protein